MASGFPGSIDSFTNPLSNSALNSPSHAGQHQDLNDAVNKIENYMGLVKVIPTAATNATISATGTITVGSGVASVVISNAFSALYDNYRIEVSGGTGTAANLTMQLSGSTGATYSTGGLFVTYGSTVLTGYGPAATTTWLVGYIGTVQSSVTIDIINPQSAKQTHMRANSASTYPYWMNGQDTSTAQSTGFSLFSTSMTGQTIRVYGYRN